MIAFEKNIWLYQFTQETADTIIESEYAAEYLSEDAKAASFKN